MKNFSAALLILISAMALSACGNPQQTYVSQLDSTGVNRPLQQGEASCNTIGIQNVFDGDLEHPNVNGTPDNAHLLVKVNSLAGGFMSGSTNSIVFFRISYNLNSSGQPVENYDSSPLVVNVVGSSTSSQAVTPASIAAAGVTGFPFYILVSGTDLPWQEIEADVNISGSVTVAQALIPLFDADPLVYEQNHAQFPQLIARHPFLSLADSTTTDFLSLDQSFCF